MICHVAVTVAAHGYIVAEVVAVCTAPCVRFGRFNAFLLLFQKEQSQGMSATSVTRGTMELTGAGSAIFYGWKYPLAIS